MVIMILLLSVYYCCNFQKLLKLLTNHPIKYDGGSLYWGIKDKKASEEHFGWYGCNGRKGCGVHDVDEYDRAVYRWYKWYEICPCVCGGKLWRDLDSDGWVFPSDSQEGSQESGISSSL